MVNYPAKLLLFGEHTVNLGSSALALPLPLFSGRLAFAKQLGSSELALRQMQLPQFAQYLVGLQERGELLAPLDVAAFRKAVADGLVFESDIPTGYGAGSSGALVAAVFSSWRVGADSGWQAEVGALRKMLAQMEAFFHGTSSGTDPLICLLQKPLVLNKDGAVVVDVPLVKSSAPQLFLLDTGRPREATEFIGYFLKQMKSSTLQMQVRMQLVPGVDAAIDHFLKGEVEEVYACFHEIGLFQHKFLRGLIPSKYRKLWATALEGDLFKLKVCGAGGGGFILGMTRSLEALRAALPKERILPVVVK